MKGKFKLHKFPRGMHYLEIDEATAKRMSKGEGKRFICTLNGAEKFHCALMRTKEGVAFVNVGSVICRKLKLRPGMIVEASFTADASRYQFAMPEELASVLQTDSEADEIFHSLTPGNQRGLIYLVTQVKSTDKRIERSLKIAAQIKSGITSPRAIANSKFQISD